MYIKIAFIKQHSLSPSVSLYHFNAPSTQCKCMHVHIVNVPFHTHSVVYSRHTYKSLGLFYSPDAIIAPTKSFVECWVFFCLYFFRCSLFVVQPLFFSASMPNWLYCARTLFLSIVLRECHECMVCYREGVCHNRPCRTMNEWTNSFSSLYKTRYAVDGNKNTPYVTWWLILLVWFVIL